ncbi:MAG: hypothetical protein P4L42_07480 [Desulfocapsaceae bacterium]|nr:hypothetical protein [Desulfocapsaceae bacterium]
MKQAKSLIDIEYSDESTADLRGRQSVRTTFKLSERSITALSILASQLGIKQKSLFDHLIDDIQALRIIARASEDLDPRERRVAKTFVISRKTLENLELVCSRFHTPRDVLVEFSIERIMPLISREKEKHEKRKIFLEELGSFLRQGGEILERAEESLGEDDLVFEKILTMMRAVKSGYDDVESMVKRGERMEGFTGRSL